LGTEGFFIGTCIIATMAVAELKTPHLLLRAWRAEDAAPYAALNADAEVMRYLLGPIDRARSDAQIQSFREHFEREGFGRWATSASSRPAWKRSSRSLSPPTCARKP